MQRRFHEAKIHVKTAVLGENICKEVVMKGRYAHKSQPKWRDKIYQTAQMSKRYMHKSCKEGKLTQKMPLRRGSMREESPNEGRVRHTEEKK